jgi:hypothetical protein
MATKVKTLEEGVAALAATLSDRDLNAAVAGKYGEHVRLLVTAEKVRRAAKSSSGSAA